MTLWARVAGSLRQGTELHSYNGSQWLKASLVMVYNGAAWQRVWPDTQNVVVTVTSVTGNTCGSAAVATGTVVSGSTVEGGTVQMQYLKYSNQTWTNVGSAVAVTGGAWSSSFSHPEAGTLQYRGIYRGGGVFLDADSAPVSRTVNISAPTGLTGGTIGNTSLQFSWTASACAGEYGIKINNQVVDYTTSTSYTRTGLTAGTSYTVKVFARHRAGDASSVISADTAQITGQTSRAAINDTGELGIHIAPYATGSFRPDLNNGNGGWGYIGADVGQGYYTQSNRNYTGCIDYYGARTQLRDALGGAGIGDNRIAGGSADSGVVYLVKQTGVGSSGSVTMYWHISDAYVNYPTAPPGTFITTTASTASGVAGDYSIPKANIQEIVLGTHRSLLLYNLSSANYCRFNGGGTTNGRIWVVWKWNYQSQSPVAGGWS